MEWSQEVVFEFLDAYENEPVIWQPGHPQHKNRNCVNDAWLQIKNKLSIQCTIADLKKKKKSLMASFRPLCRKLKASSKTGSGSEDVYKPTWFAFERMERFLHGVSVARSTYNSETFDTMWKPRQIGSKTLTFEMIEEKKILKIEDMSGNEVYLGWESVLEVWSLESVLRYRLSYSSGSNFKYFYEDVIRAVAEMSGDVKINIYNIINRLSEKSDDVCCMLEVLLFMPEKALFDVQLKRRIQEQGQKRVKKHLLKKMWMLYAQEHWTKSYDLKSAVERLYEELGALEFDADHEAIYGMERYYTVQQCEELRDKYKIGRKDSLNHSLKLNTIFSSNFCRELSDRFSKGIEICNKYLNGNICLKCLQIQLFSNNLEEYF
ncbi:hypothetical protein FQA39_LY17109 [Lamprigera yunnana]|nr:hypothetical protein FQA39_LY17109 [Lamprigera yunnana]